MSLNHNEIEVINAELEPMPAEERIAWAWDRLGTGLILSTSFGLQSSVMLDLVLKVSNEKNPENQPIGTMLPWTLTLTAIGTLNFQN